MATTRRKPAKAKTPSPLVAKYESMTIAARETYPLAPNHLLLAVLICAGADPRMVPADEPFDEHGYYQMDWQMGTRTKYPWPSDEIRDDALEALKVMADGTVHD